MPWLLAAFVGGVFVLQQQAALPPLAASLGGLTGALVGAALLLWRAPRTHGARRATLLAAALCCGIAGFTYAEAAHALRIPNGTVMSRLYRARERLSVALAV